MKEIKYKELTAKVSEDENYWYVDFRTGYGTGVYPKCDWTLDEALADQYGL